MHHPLWDDNQDHRLFNNNNLISPLLDLLVTHNMTLSLPPGIPTYKMANGNWTRPDNIWCSSNPIDPIISCNIKPSLHPPHADHLLIITELDLTPIRANTLLAHNLCNADFTIINERLKIKFETLGPAKQICRRVYIELAIDMLVNTLSETINEVVPLSKPSPYAKCWWTKELTNLKREKNWLSNLSYRMRGLPDTPIYTFHRELVNRFCNKVDETKKKYWINWLEAATSRDIYVANKYITDNPSDYTNARIPILSISSPEGI